MSDNMLETIEAKIDALISRCTELEKEAADLRAKESGWKQERSRLIEKNDKARTRVEAIISHLKSLSTDSEQKAS